jgi:acyl-CoA synthetase (AMP-forming)/AMP-acid ligase II
MNPDTAIVLDEPVVEAMARAVLASLRELGIGETQPVALLAGTGLEFVAVRDAVTAVGGLLVPVNPKLTAPEVRYILEHSGARVAFAQRALVEVARRAAPEGVRIVEVGAHAAEGGGVTDPRAIGATLIYTSGTTGWPKGCVRTDAQEMARAEEIIATYDLGPGDVHLIACPLAHSAPGIFLRAGRRVGAATVLMPKFEPRAFLAAAAAHRASIFFLVPTQYERLLALPDAERRRWDLSAVRAAIVAGAPITIETKRRLVSWLGEDKLWEFYGSSETGTISVLRPEDQLARPGSVGRPPQGVRLHLVRDDGAPAQVGEVGEIYVDSPAVMSGYLDPATGREIPRDPAGGVSVGDLGRLDEDGYLYLVDRKHDTIITGGVNVYPAEVERALAEHPDVIAAIVAGVPDPAWGQRVAALVAVRPGGAGEHELRAFLRARLAPFKLPKQIEFAAADDLPIGSSGKPLRREAARRLRHAAKP